MPEDGWINRYRVGSFAFSLGGRDPQLRQLADAVYSGTRAAQGEAGVRFELAARRRPHGALRARGGAGAGALDGRDVLRQRDRQCAK